MILKNYSVPVLTLSFLVFFSACRKETDTPCEGSFTVDLGNDTTIREGEVLLLDAGNPGSEFLWSNGAVSQKISVDTTGKYWVRVTNDCGSFSDTIQVFLKYKTISIDTWFGTFYMWLYHKTPLHRANFLSLAESGFFDGLLFHRVIYDFVVQGGDPEGTGYGGPGYTIPAEIIPGLIHQYGAAGAARMGDDVNPDKESNGSQFYIVCDPNGEPALNGNYTVFGFVFAGMEVVYEISKVEVDSAHRPIEDVVMKSLHVEYFTASQLQSQFNFSID
jgi:cyclophilin family peptidyl-prolyl cis-trans isomerase